MSFAAPAAPAAAGTAEGPAIGIDLGSAHSRAAVWRDGRVEVIPNDLGGRATPSCVAFAGGELLLGDAAKSQSSLDPASAVRDLLHLLGSRVEDPHLRSRLGRWPFAVAAAPGGGGWALSIGVGGGEERRELAPEELAGLLLRSIKAQAERFLRCSVARSVISIPGHFNDGQRRATRDAARLAGFDRVELIPDSVAAAISYTTDELGARTTEERNMLVLCMGAGQLDVALHTVVDGIYETKAVTGSPVGGADIDDALLNHLVAELPQRQGAPEQQLGARARQRLRTASERMKRALSTENQAEMRIEALLGGQDFHATVRREQLEELCQPLLARCQRAVQDVLTDAAVSEESVADVVQWRHWFQNPDGVIFVVDSNDRDRMAQACDELRRMLTEDELRDACLLVFANKQDLPRAMSTAEVTEQLGLQQMCGRQWCIQGSCATTGEGLFEGMDWLAAACKEQHK